MRAHLPDKSFFIGKRVPGHADAIVETYVASGNDGHLFRAHSESLGRNLACKVIPESNLVTGPSGEEKWREEVSKADVLRNPAVVRFEAVLDWREGDIDCVVLISEYIEGISLRRFIDKRADEITIQFITNWLGTMLDLLHEMNLRHISHGDLHAGNILVEDRSYALRGDRFVFRVTDFGAGDFTSSHRFKDDYLMVADTLSQLLAAVGDREHSPRDKYTFGILRDHLLRHLVELDRTRDPLAKNPAELYKRLLKIDEEFENAATSKTQLMTPFDFLNCEQIGDAPILLRSLYSEKFLGLSEIESRNNVVVTGPRGCGKSTVFRSLSLDQKIAINEAAPDQATYLGIYYQCIDLYFAFPRYIPPSRPEAVDLPLHFLSATLLAKLIDGVETWAKQYFSNEFSRLEALAAEQVWKILGLQVPEVPGANSFRALSTALENQRTKAAELQRFANDAKRPIGNNFGADAVQNVCKQLATTFAFLRDRPIYFFIDDYSSPKVTRALQLNLNRLLMQRSGWCFYKISTESSVSFFRSDIDGKTYVESREFILQHLGLIYLHADSNVKLDFIDDVFRRRLSSAQNQFPAKELAELLGSHPSHNNNEDARSIKAGGKIEYWGKECLSRLCSGDIHYVISLVGDMVRLAGGVEAIRVADGPLRISAKAQNRAIREAAGGFLRSLRGVPQYGAELVAVVEAFGSVASSYIKFRTSKNEEGSPPHQASRIEPYDAFTLSENGQKVYEELLRYSVFIEDFRGKSRRGKVVPRLYLRRFLIPHFNLTFSMRDSVELEPASFEMFLSQPKAFAEKYRLKSAAESLDEGEGVPHVPPMQESFDFKEVPRESDGNTHS